MPNTFREKLAILIGGKKFAFLVQTAEKHNQTAELVNQYLQKLSKLISPPLNKDLFEQSLDIITATKCKNIQIIYQNPGVDDVAVRLMKGTKNIAHITMEPMTVIIKANI